MTQAELDAAASGLAARLSATGLLLGTAESCSGGLIAHTLTNVSGSSAWFRGGIVAYANEIKTRLLGVSPDVLAAHGAVSEATVLAMAAGARAALDCQVSLAVSGIAGPSGGTPDKPVGLVWMAWATPTRLEAEHFHFPGGRLDVKMATALSAMRGLAERL